MGSSDQLVSTRIIPKSNIFFFLFDHHRGLGRRLGSEHTVRSNADISPAVIKRSDQGTGSENEEQDLLRSSRIHVHGNSEAPEVCRVRKKLFSLLILSIIVATRSGTVLSIF